MNQILCKEARKAVTVVMALLFIAGCAHNPHFEVMNFSTVSEVPADEVLPVSYTVSISLDYPVVKGDTTHVATAYRHAIVENAFGWQFDTLDVEAAGEVYANSLKGDFNALASEMKSAGMYEGGDDDSAAWFDNVTGYFAGSRKGYSSYVLDFSGYAGGAHPESGTVGLVFDLRKGVQVTLDDLFKPDSEDLLGSLISRHAEECLPEGGMEALYGTDIMPTGNFVITGRSITFIYNPYEIAPYFLGVIQISVPLKECKAAGILAVEL
ncbi:MAG: RsiV family protein [Bacteroidia bacterium]|nr:RsiV family protein [Bacteroidia bacterium]